MHLHCGPIICKVFYVNKFLSALTRVYAVIAFASMCVKLFLRYKTSLSLSTDRRWHSQVKEMLCHFWVGTLISGVSTWTMSCVSMKPMSWSKFTYHDGLLGHMGQASTQPATKASLLQGSRAEGQVSLDLRSPPGERDDASWKFLILL